MIKPRKKQPLKFGTLSLGADSKIPLNGGLCLKYQETALAYNQSPLIQNLNADDRGSLIKRWGLVYAYAISLGVGSVNGVYDGLFHGNLVFAWGGNLYTQTGSNQPVKIHSGLANSKSFLFIYNSILYIQDGTGFTQYDGTTVKAVVPYNPIIYILCAPDLSLKTVNESWNLLGNGFSLQYNGDGATTSYKLPFQSLEATTVVCSVNGVTLVEGVGFTVNRVTGYVTFTVAPTLAGDINKNNVTITAYKLQAGLAAQILGCTKAIECYSVMWFTGNPNLPNYYFAGGTTTLLDASYFPQNRFYTLKGNDKAVTGFALHYGELIIFKEDLIARITETTDLNDNISFPPDFINNKIGCDMPDSIQIANNDIVFCNTYGGAYILQNKLNNYTDAKVVQPISGNINGTVERPGLLQMQISDLKKASSYTYGNKYYICVTNIAYIWDFDISYYQQDATDESQYALTWWYYTNVNAATFFSINNSLYFADRTNGLIAQFTNILNDFGLAINAIWRSKLIDFDAPNWFKTIVNKWITTRANSGSTITINYYNDEKTLVGTKIVPSTTTKSFSFANFSFANFTFSVQRFAPTIPDNKAINQIKYFQIEMSNNNFNENLSIITIVIRYILTKMIR